MKPIWLIGLLLFLAGSIFALSSYGDTELFTLDTVPPALELTSPQDGEIWYIGDTQDITWTATDTNLNPNSVYLWYSLNAGSSYTTLAEAVYNDGSEPWILPSIQTTNGRVKIKVFDSFGNFTQKSSLGAFTISYVPPDTPTGLTVDTSNNLDALLNWQPVIQTIPPYNTPITPDGYIVLYNETPYEDEQFYYFLGRSFTTTYTHHDVAEFRSQMFYRVLAYKNYRNEDFNLLDNLAAKQPLRWKDAWDILNQGGGK